MTASLPPSMYMFNGILSLGVMVLGLVIFLRTPLARSRLWTIVITPLASIIGSGFLVVAPLLYLNFGHLHSVAMAALSLFAMVIGAVMAVNILYFEPTLALNNGRSGILLQVERLAKLVLGLAYIISVAFYLSLLSAFALELLGLRTGLATRLLTTSLLMLIGLRGIRRGLHGLEDLERVAVNVKLAIILGLLVALGVGYGYLRANGGGVAALPRPQIGWHSLLTLGGMLLVVQGFETARYLGKDYSPEERVRGQFLAQAIAAVVYILFVPLAAPLAGDLGRATDETAIIQIVGRAAFLLGPTLALAAVFSQFGAAVADTIGSGGIIAEATRGRISRRQGYLIITLLALALIWTRGVFSVLTLASRAFALYYGLQAIIAAVIALERRELRGRRLLFPGFLILALALLIIAVLAQPPH